MWTSDGKVKPKNNENYKLITVGCDPEFLLMDGPLPVKAYLWLPYEGGLGVDGSGKQAELRPRPSQFASTVVQRLYTIINEAPEEIKAFDWYCGSGLPSWPTGGHIHLGSYGLRYSGRRVFEGRQPELTLLISSLLMPFALALSDPKAVTARRETKQYGSFLDEREQRWGMEHRALPSWLYDPMVAFFFLSVAKLAAVEYAAKRFSVTGLAKMMPIHLLYALGSGAELKRLALDSLDSQVELVSELEGWDKGTQMTTSLHHVLRLIDAGKVWDGVNFRKNWTEKLLPDRSKEKEAQIEATQELEEPPMMEVDELAEIGGHTVDSWRVANGATDTVWVWTPTPLYDTRLPDANTRPTQR